MEQTDRRMDLGKGTKWLMSKIRSFDYVFVTKLYCMYFLIFIKGLFTCIRGTADFFLVIMKI